MDFSVAIHNVEKHIPCYWKHDISFEIASHTSIFVTNFWLWNSYPIFYETQFLFMNSYCGLCTLNQEIWKYIKRRYQYPYHNITYIYNAHLQCIIYLYLSNKFERISGFEFISMLMSRDENSLQSQQLHIQVRHTCLFVYFIFWQRWVSWVSFHFLIQRLKVQRNVEIKIF